MLKIKHTSSKVLLAIGGAVYLTTFSNLNINIFFKSYVVIIPVQLLALVYGIYLIYNNQQKRRH
jgi:uncharacterized membrane protein